MSEKPLQKVIVKEPATVSVPAVAEASPPPAAVTAETPDNKGYQSADALRVATAPKVEGAPHHAEISPVAAPKASEKMVKVRPREHVKNMRLGSRFFNLVAGKDNFVPEYVRAHLEEKGLLLEEQARRWCRGLFLEIGDGDATRSRNRTPSSHLGCTVLAARV